MVNVRNTAYFFITAMSLVLILVLGKKLLLPFVFAILFWFAVRQIRLFMDKSNFLKNKIPAFAKNMISIVLIFFVASNIFSIIASSINKLASSARKYEANVNTLMSKIYDSFNVDVLEHVHQYINDLSFANLFMSLINISTDIASTVFMVMIYSIFIFLEESTFNDKFRRIFSNETKYKKATVTLANIEAAIAKYLGVKTVVSLLTGTLSFFVLLIFGVESPFFWAFVIFLFNYIPTIGSIIATVFPVVFSLLQFGDFMPGVLILAFLTSIQIVVGNILDPKLMSDSMNISPLVTILSLSFWGAVWGVTGMILSVPIVVATIIILNQFPSTQPIAVMLSGKERTQTQT